METVSEASFGLVPSKPKKNGTFGTFFGHQPTKILKIGTCKFGRKFLHWRIFHNTKFYVLKDVRDAFSRFKPFPGHSMDTQQWAVKKSSDAVGKFSACKFIKRFWALFLDLCVQKRRNLLWSSDAFCKSSPCKLCEKFWGHIIDFCVQKWSCLLFTSDAIRKFSSYEVYELKFRRIFEVLRLQGLQKKFWAHIYDLCVQKRSCLLCSSDAFWKVSACKIDEKILGAFSRFVCRANKHSWLKHFVKMFRARYVLQFCAPINFSVLLGHTEKFLACTFYKNALNLNTFGLRVHPQIARAPTNCDARVWLHAKHFQTSVGPAPQTCFVICELWKSEQILWILT